MNWLEFAPVLQIFLAEALAKPTVLSITPEVCLSTWNQMQTCAEHMWLASVTAVVGSTRETLGVRLAVNDRVDPNKQEVFTNLILTKKKRKSLASGIWYWRWEERILLYSCTFQFSIH